MGTSNDPEARLVKSKLPPLMPAIFSVCFTTSLQFTPLTPLGVDFAIRSWKQMERLNVRLDWKHFHGEVATVNNNH